MSKDERGEISGTPPLIDWLKFYYYFAGIGTIILVVVTPFPATKLKPEAQIITFGFNRFAFTPKSR
jgi:hypothetical protein